MAKALLGHIGYDRYSSPYGFGSHPAAMRNASMRGTGAFAVEVVQVQRRDELVEELAEVAVEEVAQLVDLETEYLGQEAVAETVELSPV